jgi:hypothetical protein
MDKENFQKRQINFEDESCPPSWCPLEGEPGCCHGCELCHYEYKNEDIDKLFCSHPDAYSKIGKLSIN